MRHILESLKSEFITIKDDEDGRSYTVRVWHVLAFAFVVGWLIG